MTGSKAENQANTQKRTKKRQQRELKYTSLEKYLRYKQRGSQQTAKRFSL